MPKVTRSAYIKVCLVRLSKWHVTLTFDNIIPRSIVHSQDPVKTIRAYNAPHEWEKVRFLPTTNPISTQIAASRMLPGFLCKPTSGYFSFQERKGRYYSTFYSLEAHFDKGTGRGMDLMSSFRISETSFEKI